jgi:hypothetical protein
VPDVDVASATAQPMAMDASSVQMASDGSRRIVWMIMGLIKGHPTENRMARQLSSVRHPLLAARNSAGRGVNWRFTTEDTRIKLHHLYPTTQG